MKEKYCSSGLCYDRCDMFNWGEPTYSETYPSSKLIIKYNEWETDSCIKAEYIISNEMKKKLTAEVSLEELGEIQ